MDLLKLAIDSSLPLVYIRTDDVINVEEVLSFISGTSVTPVNLPEMIAKVSDLKFPEARVLYTSSECRSLAKLYRAAIDMEKTIVFINTEKSVLQLDGGTLVPPKALVLKFLTDMGVSENPEELLPAFGGLTLKDIGEIAKMTMTRDESLTPRGISETRRGYNKLQGITQVDTEQDYYVCPNELQKWLKANIGFFKSPKHPSLTPRGLLFDGPPGTGKTLASKYIAQQFGVPLYRLDLGAMMGKYVGESEGNLNAALAQVDEVEPCVIIFDEVEKVFQSTSDSGVTSRLLSQLLWWLQEHKTKVFTVMTTNKMSAIPAELYREGRIDRTMAFLGIEKFSDGYDFAKGAFDSMLAEMSAEATAEDYTELTKRVKTLFVDGLPVPQSKITQSTYALVRESLSAEDDPGIVVGYDFSKEKDQTATVVLTKESTVSGSTKVTKITKKSK
jgi:PIN domain nuclease of toxin-antitoxin system